jgi:hypothetical protein
VLEPIEQAVLVAIDNLVRDTLDSTDGQAITGELERMGVEPPNSLKLGRLVGHLKKEGYLKDSAFISANGPIFVELNGRGREQARANTEPFAHIMAENRRLIASKKFAEAFPKVFEPWADAEKLLFAEDTEAQLTTVGHKVREAAQAFATSMIAAYGADEPVADVKAVKKRLGAVIAYNLTRLGPTHQKVLENIGNLWESTVDLIERQEHAAQKEGEPVTWDDGRRIVTLTMVLMVEFVTILEERKEPPPATLEPAG